MNELRSQRRFDSSTADGGSSTGAGGETEGGVVGPLTGGFATSSSESSLLSEQESEPESELELALPELGGACPGGLGGLWWAWGVGERLLFTGLEIVGESILGGVGIGCFINGDAAGGLRGLGGDSGPIGDIPIGDIGGKGGPAADAITGSRGAVKLQKEKKRGAFSEINWRVKLHLSKIIENK